MTLNTGTFESVPGRTSTPFPRITASRVLVAPSHSCAGLSSSSRSAACQGGPQRRRYCGSGGAGQVRRTWPSSGGPTSAASTWSSPYRFVPLRQGLNWATPRPRSPEQADRWTWLVVLASTQLRLARPLVADQRLPWERRLPPDARTPARVRRAFSSLFPALGTPATVPKPCGRSPGRPKGRRSKPARRFPGVKTTR
jgi:hypothetical protein